MQDCSQQCRVEPHRDRGREGPDEKKEYHCQELATEYHHNEREHQVERSPVGLEIRPFISVAGASFFIHRSSLLLCLLFMSGPDFPSGVSGLISEYSLFFVVSPAYQGARLRVDFLNI